jgi:hypothetical protein
MGVFGQHRQRKLDITVATIQRQHGPWALVKGGASLAAGLATIARISTGFPALDQALAIGGLPLGQVCELDLSRLLVGRPQDTREALAMAETLASSGGLAALAFDALDFTSWRAWTSICLCPPPFKVPCATR